MLQWESTRPAGGAIPDGVESGSLLDQLVELFQMVWKVGVY